MKTSSSRHYGKLFALALLGLCSSPLLAQRTFTHTAGDTTYTMKQYWFVLYTRGDAAPLDSATSAAKLKEHLAYQDMQAERGLIVMAGPFGDNGNWRGLLLYDVETKEEVEGYLKGDPLVQAGRLKYEVHPWYGAVGTRLK
ncbi:MAG: hypothetical protein IPJ76_06290 [Flavobacteriales bacterium]|nr:MAG: hypothetical protein IPJ76_06290 [Flavobacteriales bacterium]